MYATFGRIIRSGKYDLASLTARVNFYHANGQLTDDQRRDLLSLAQEQAAQAMTMDYKAEILALWERVHALENRMDQPPVQQEEAETPDTPDAWPLFTQPTGVHNAYHAGDQVTFENKRYICRMAACVWSPAVYPSAWEEVPLERQS
ncbi:MAG: hypothetical protein IJ189_05985 [Clostridia bacterium]|nr:hypothetical protein [Clostridia bacterium]